VPIMNWVSEIIDANDEQVTVNQLIENKIYTLHSAYPCVICVENSIGIPRVPSLSLKLSAKRKKIQRMSLADLGNADPICYGSSGSPTAVRDIFTPKPQKRGVIYSESADFLSKKLQEDISSFLKNNREEQYVD